MKNELIKLIADKEYEVVYNILLKFCQDSSFSSNLMENSITVNRISNQNLQNANLNGLINHKDYEIAQNRINLTLLEIIDKLYKEENTKHEPKIKLGFSKRPKKLKKNINPNEIIISSPTGGSIYFNEKPGSEDLIYGGKKVNKGDLVYLVGHMKIWSHIHTEYSGVVKRVYVNNGDWIETGDDIFLLEGNSKTKISSIDPSEVKLTNSIGSRDFISIYYPVLQSSKEVESYMLINPLEGDIVFPDINYLIRFAKKGIKKGEWLYEIVRDGKIFDIIAPFDCILNTVLFKEKKANCKEGQMIFNVSKLNS